MLKGIIFTVSMFIFIGCGSNSSSSEVDRAISTKYRLSEGEFSDEGVVEKDLKVDLSIDISLKISEGTKFLDENGDIVTTSPIIELVKSNLKDIKIKFKDKNENRLIPTEPIDILIKAPDGAQVGDMVELDILETKSEYGKRVDKSTLYIVDESGFIDILIYPNLFKGRDVEVTLLGVVDKNGSREDMSVNENYIDSEILSERENFNINKFLLFSAVPKKSVNIYDAYQLKLDINSSSEYNITLENAPSWLKLDKSRNIVEGVVLDDSKSRYSDITIIVENGDGISKSISFNLDIYSPKNIAYLYGIATQPPKNNYAWYLPPLLAIDGNLSTYNHTQDNSRLNWMELRLPDNVDIKEVVVYNRADLTSYRLDNAKIYICKESINTDISKLSNCNEIYSLNSSIEAQTWKNEDGVSGDFIVLKAKEDNSLHIAEIEVYGTLPTAPIFLNEKFNIVVDKWQNIFEPIFKIEALDYQDDNLAYSISNDVPFSINSSGEIRVNGILDSSFYDINVTISDGINSSSRILTVDVQDKPIVKSPLGFNSNTPIISGYLPNIYGRGDNISVIIDGKSYTPLVGDSNWTISEISPPLEEGDYNITLNIDGTYITYENYLKIYKSRYQKSIYSLAPKSIEDVDVYISSSKVTPRRVGESVRGSSISLINDNGIIKLQNSSYRTLSSLIGRYKDDSGNYTYVRLKFNQNILPYSTNILESFENDNIMEIFNTAGSFDLKVQFGSLEYNCSNSEMEETKYCNPTTKIDEVYSNGASEIVKSRSISEQEIYSIMLATYHHFYNSIDSLNSFRAWVYNSKYKGIEFGGETQNFKEYEGYVKDNNFTKDSYINYHFMHMISPDHNINILVMRYKYIAEGMGILGDRASLFGYKSTSGWVSLWEGTLDFSNSLDYDSFHHEIMHTYGFSHDSGITYGWSHTFAKTIPNLYQLAKAPVSNAPKYFFDTKLKDRDKIQLTFYKTSDSNGGNITVDFFSAVKIFNSDFRIVKESSDAPNQLTLIRKNSLFNRLILRVYGDDSLEIASRVIDYKDYFLEIGRVARDSKNSDYYALGKSDWLNAYQVYENDFTLKNFKTVIYDIEKGCKAIFGESSYVAFDKNTTNIENYGDIIRDKIPTLRVVERRGEWYQYYIRDFSLNNDESNWGEELPYKKEVSLDNAYIMCVVPKI